jgi:putative restriction endonuclease
MANAVFYHKLDSIYDDRPEQFYHFPSQYLSRVEQTVGDRIVYYGPDAESRPGYRATAVVAGVRKDPNRMDHYYADIKTDEYLDFDRLVPYQENGGYECKLFTAEGKVNGGRAVQAVRIIEPYEFAAIVEAGLSQPDEWPDRDEAIGDYSGVIGFGEEPQAEFHRPVVQQLLNRPFRDAKFKQHVRKVYNRTCAFTGLRLINGKGRPEVEAAHIKPVEHNGPDSIRNGIALSATVHWMFDRGLISLSDDFTILTSRHLNHDVSHLLRPEMKALVPGDPRLQPHPQYLDWHRTVRFKA